MATARLRDRAASARPLGVARLDGLRVALQQAEPRRHGQGEPRAGRPTPRPGACSTKSKAADLETLDRSEGGYERIAVVVRLGDAAMREAYTYVSAAPLRRRRRPGATGISRSSSPARASTGCPTRGCNRSSRRAASREEIVFDDPDNVCFGCSTNNPRGLGLRFERAGPDAVETRYVAAEDLCGRRGVVHGGVQADLLDEAMGFAAHAALGEVDVATVELSLRYRRPTPTGEPLLIRAQLVRSEDRDVWLRGEIRDAGGRVCTEATSRWRQLRS